jgi:hypothetical protein
MLDEVGATHQVVWPVPADRAARAHSHPEEQAEHCGEFLIDAHPEPVRRR